MLVCFHEVWNPVFNGLVSENKFQAINFWTLIAMWESRPNYSLTNEFPKDSSLSGLGEANETLMQILMNVPTEKIFKRWRSVVMSAENLEL